MAAWASSREIGGYVNCFSGARFVTAGGGEFKEKCLRVFCFRVRLR